VALTPEGREVAGAFHRDISEELERLTAVLAASDKIASGWRRSASMKSVRPSGALISRARA
jgi:hypothetical protein